VVSHSVDPSSKVLVSFAASCAYRLQHGLWSTFQIGRGAVASQVFDTCSITNIAIPLCATPGVSNLTVVARKNYYIMDNLQKSRYCCQAKEPYHVAVLQSVDGPFIARTIACNFPRQQHGSRTFCRFWQRTVGAKAVHPTKRLQFFVPRRLT
jgi:hypothetical protein